MRNIIICFRSRQVGIIKSHENKITKYNSLWKELCEKFQLLRAFRITYYWNTTEINKNQWLIQVVKMLMVDDPIIR